MDSFALELAKHIEKLAVEEGKDLKECIKAGIDLIRMQTMKKQTSNFNQYRKNFYSMFKGWY